MFFLTGEYDHQVDAKNRIRIPAKLKGKEQKLYFTKGTNHCLFVFYEDVMQEELKKFSEIKITDAEKQKGMRSFIKSMRLVELDPQGRLVIPSDLIAHARINKDIKICGAGTRIEIWSKEVYDEYFGDDSENFDSIFESLGI